MRSAILFPSSNLARTATVSLASGAASASHPLANLTSGDIALPFIASASGAVRIVFDCGSAAQVDGAFLPMANIPAGTVVKFQGHTSSSWGTPDVDVTVTIPAFSSMGPDLDPIPGAPWADVLSAYPTALNRTKRYWSLSVASFASALAIGEVLFGALEVLDVFIQGSNERSQAQATIAKESAFGSRWTLRYPIRRRRWGLTSGLEDADLAVFLALDDEVGGDAGDPFVLVPDITENDAALVSGTNLPTRTMLVDGYHQGQPAFVEVQRGLPL